MSDSRDKPTPQQCDQCAHAWMAQLGPFLAQYWRKHPPATVGDMRRLNAGLTILVCYSLDLPPGQVLEAMQDAEDVLTAYKRAERAPTTVRPKPTRPNPAGLRAVARAH